MISSGAKSGTVTVVHAAHDLDLPLAGFPIEEVQFSLRDVLNVDMDADAYIGGRLASASYRLRPGDRLEFIQKWGRKAADPAHHDRLAIDRINQTPMADLRFRDFWLLKSGRDEFSTMRLADLHETVALDVIAAVAAAFTDDEDLQARCYRWVLRGLEVEKAIRKVATDVEVGENARKAWIKDQRPWK